MKTSLLFCAAFLLCAAALAQDNEDLVLLFESEPGMRPAHLFTDSFTSSDPLPPGFDMNGDGTVDLILHREDEEGTLKGFRVLDGRTRAMLWQVEDMQATFGYTATDDLWQFADPNGDGKREAVFSVEDVAANQGVVLIDPGDNTTVWSFYPFWPCKLLGVRDLSGDGSEDLILLRLDTRQLQIWGDPHVDEP